MKGKEQLSFEIEEEKSKSDNKEEKYWKLEFYEEKNFKDTEIGPIPEDWEVVRLGEVAKFSRGLSWRKEDETDFSTGKLVISIPNIEKDRINFNSKFNHYLKKAIPHDKKLKIGDILYVGSSGSLKNIGRNVFIDYLPFEEVGFASFTFKATPIKGKVDNRFFYFLSNSFWVCFENYAKRASDGKFNFLLNEFIERNLIPLPPLSEQKAIAEVLSTIQSAREKTEEVIKATKELKKSIMKHLFTYGPVPIDQIDKIKLKETEIGPIPEHWEVVRLGEVLDKKVSFISTNINHNEKIPFIPMSLIPVEKVYIEKWEYKSKEEIKSGILVFEGDLLLAKITPCFENGKQGIVINLPNKYAYATTEVIPIRLVSKVSNIFLAYYLSNKKIREILIPKMEGTTGRKRLPKSQLETLPIPLPPLAEQQKISEILQSIDEKIQKEEEKKKALDNLFKSMLSNLMSGKIRIKILEGD